MKKVITYGTFDLFHQGHLNLLTRAKTLGDYLIVGVTTEHFDEARGKVNVVDTTIERIENVRRTGLADEIIIEDHEGQKIEDIKKYGVDVFTLGSDWEGAYDYLKEYCEVVYLPRTPDISSTLLRNDRFKIVNIGIIGTGRIVPRFISEEKYVSGASIVCAYNPEGESGKKFEKNFGIEVYSDNFEKFLDQVDAVYIASPNETHYGYAKEALVHDKHVLSENPLAYSYDNTVELFDIAREKNLVLMEGVKTAYCPGFVQLIDVAKSGKVGEIKDVEACLTRLAGVASRERTDIENGGAFLEYAAYTLLPIFKLLGTDYKDVKFHSIYDENGVDIYTKIELLYEDAMATAKCGVGIKSEGQLVIAGSKGYVLAESPWWLTNKFEIRYEDPGVIDEFKPRFQGDGLRYELAEFIAKINGIEKREYKQSESEMIALSKITEQFLVQKRNRK